MKTKNNGKTSTGKKMAMGAGVIVASALAYEFLGPNGKKNRKIVKSWAKNMEKDMVKKFENAKEQSLPVYHRILEEVKEKYEKVKSIDRKELDGVVADLRKHWKNISGKKSAKKARK